MQNIDDHINTKSPYEVIPITVTPQKSYIVTSSPYEVIPITVTPQRLYIVTKFPDQFTSTIIYLFAKSHANDIVQQNLQSNYLLSYNTCICLTVKSL